jgi:hypothetical protein
LTVEEMLVLSGDPRAAEFAMLRRLARAREPAQGKECVDSWSGSGVGCLLKVDHATIQQPSTQAAGVASAGQWGRQIAD